MSSISEYWEKFLAQSGKKSDEVAFSGEIGYEGYSLDGEDLLTLVLNGKKTASFTCYDSYEINRELLPVPGEYYIVEDGDDKPVCIIQLLDVKVLPFKDVTWDMAVKEGEDDNLSSWREKQMDYMTDEAAICGFDFTEDSSVVFESFKIVYR